MAFSLRHACHGPLKNLRAPSLELEHGRADRLEEPAVVRHQHDRGVEARQVLLEPFERLDVEVVRRLVEQQQVGIAGESPPERGARQLAAREGPESTVESGVVSETKAAERRQRPVAPPVPAGVLEPGLRLGVAAERGVVVGALCHRLLERRELLLDRDQLARARQHVLAEAEVALARRALVVERDLGVLGQHQLAEVDRRLAGQHPEQRRLAGAVAPGQRHPVAALELERDAAQQRLAGDVLAQVGCDDYGHVCE